MRLLLGKWKIAGQVATSQRLQSLMKAEIQSGKADTGFADLFEDGNLGQKSKSSTRIFRHQRVLQPDFLLSKSKSAISLR